MFLEFLVCLEMGNFSISSAEQPSIDSTSCLVFYVKLNMVPTLTKVHYYVN